MAYNLFSHPWLCLFVMFLVGVFVVSGSKTTYNILRYGAIGNGKTDSSQALLTAWSYACKDSGSTVIIPKGNFLLNPVKFNGPCAGPLWFVVRGVLKAPPNTFLDSGEWILFNNLQDVSVIGNGVIDGQGAYAWSVNPCKFNPNCSPLPANIKFNGVTRGHIEGITSRNSKYFHIVIDNSENVEIENIAITAPANSNNTDGIHISRSKNVQVHNADIGTGDDCISFGPGSTNVMVSQVNCGPGHGISIGSLGKYENEEDVSGIVVKNCTLSKTTNGLRIKTWAPSPPSKLSNVIFQDIILNDVDNPILIDQHYCPHDKCQQQGDSQVEISNVKYLNIIGNSYTEMSANFNCSKGVPCQGIFLGNLDIVYDNKPTKADCYNFNGKFNGCHSPNCCAYIPWA